jgi:hypothetical protein
MSDPHADPKATLRRTYDQLVVELEATTDTERRESVALLHHTLERLPSHQQRSEPDDRPLNGSSRIRRGYPLPPRAELRAGTDAGVPASERKRPSGQPQRINRDTTASGSNRRRR